MAAASGVYNMIRPTTTETGSRTIIQVGLVANTAMEITRAWVSQNTSTTTQQILTRLLRKTVAATVTGQSPLAVSPGMQASKFVSGTSASGINASAEGTDSDVLAEDGYNVVNGWLYVPVPEERIMSVGVGTGTKSWIALKLPSAVTSVGLVGGVQWIEYQG